MFLQEAWPSTKLATTFVAFGASIFEKSFCMIRCLQAILRCSAERFSGSFTTRTCMLLSILLHLSLGPLHGTKLVTYYFRGETRIGAWTTEGVIDLNRAYQEMLAEKGIPRAADRAQALVPPNMVALLSGEEMSLEAAHQAIRWAEGKRLAHRRGTQSALETKETLTHLGIWFKHSEVDLRPPIPHPPHLFAIGLNYQQHAAEIDQEVPAYPVVFTKEGRVIGPGDEILVPPAVEQVDYEVELAVVIGKSARNVSEREAYAYVAGYMTFNDITSRDFQHRVSQWTLGKSPDTFSAQGPFLVLKDEVPDPHRLKIRSQIGSEIMQQSDTGEMIFSIPRIIAYISQVTTLVPGTVIATGTPPGVGAGRDPPRFLLPGETIAVEVESLGLLQNRVVEQKGSRNAN